MGDDNPTNPFNISTDDLESEEEAEKLFSKLVDEEPIIGDIIEEIQRRQWVDTTFDTELKVKTGETLLLTSHVSEKEVDFYMNMDDCYDIFKMVRDDFDRGEISQELVDLYHSNAEQYIQEAEEYLEEIERELFGPAYSDLITIRKSDRNDKEEILGSIKEPVLNNPDNEELVNKRNRLLYAKNSLETFPYDEEDLEGELPRIGSDEMRVLKHFSIQIYNPKLYTSLFQFEEEFEDFPLRWLTHLTIPEIRTLYRKYKSGDDVEQAVVAEVDGDEYLDNLVTESIKLPSLREREEIISEVVENYKDGRYASVINLLYPQIEHIIWIYAAFLDEKKEVDIFIEVDYDDFWRFNYRDHDDLEVQSQTGNCIEEPHIRDLVQNTPVSNHFNENVVEYFVNELFEKRNPILHGNTPNYYSQSEAAKKIVFFNTIVEKLSESVIETTADHLEQTIKDENGGWPTELANAVSEE
ncbi:hypothetical protein [Natrinema versiforme]|uniref:Uncharacterized protein n=1 Tax=Natrinema versiforme TaxID=88724 RepID=A0A4V1FYY6_9EURY|nr:hypothetical protein [Natrinema versiforme]QCS41487.1 hypothetical protein FEJ81_03630 [Natrinema versiforme]